MNPLLIRLDQQERRWYREQSVEAGLRQSSDAQLLIEAGIDLGLPKVH